jgi:23S rRNA G2445 N2-methylase RlmL
MEEITLIATTKFGVETLVKRELQDLGFADLLVSEGRVEFTTAPRGLYAMYSVLLSACFPMCDSKAHLSR